MRDIALGIVIGIVIGAIAVYAVTAKPSEEEFCPANAVLDKNTIESVTKKLNNLVHMNNPGVNVRISDYSPYGEVYRVKVEFYDDRGTLETYDMFLTANGSILFTNYVDLNKLSEEVGEQRTNANEEVVEQRINASADDDPYRGAEDAEVVIIEFSEYACPYCAKFALEVEPEILRNYGDKVKIVFRDFPVHGEAAYFAAEAANCAGEQGKYWEMHDMLFENQREWLEFNETLTANRTAIKSYAEKLGLNMDDFEACISSGKYRDEVEKDLQDGISYGVSGTPTFFINGKMVVEFRSYEVFAALIEEELKKK